MCDRDQNALSCVGIGSELLPGQLTVVKALKQNHTYDFCRSFVICSLQGPSLDEAHSKHAAMRGPFSSSTWFTYESDRWLSTGCSTKGGSDHNEWACVVKWQARRHVGLNHSSPLLLFLFGCESRGFWVWLKTCSETHIWPCVCVCIFVLCESLYVTSSFPAWSHQKERSDLTTTLLCVYCFVAVVWNSILKITLSNMQWVLCLLWATEKFVVAPLRVNGSLLGIWNESVKMIFLPGSGFEPGLFHCPLSLCFLIWTGIVRLIL